MFLSFTYIHDGIHFRNGFIISWKLVYLDVITNSDMILFLKFCSSLLVMLSALPIIGIMYTY